MAAGIHKDETCHLATRLAPRQERSSLPASHIYWNPFHPKKLLTKSVQVFEFWMSFEWFLNDFWWFLMIFGPTSKIAGPKFCSEKSPRPAPPTACWKRWRPQSRAARRPATHPAAVCRHPRTLLPRGHAWCQFAADLNFGWGSWPIKRFGADNYTCKTMMTKCA